MAGPLGSLLGLDKQPWYNSVSGALGSASDALLGAAQTPGNPWGGAAAGAVAGRQRRLEENMIAEESKREQGINATAQYLRNQGQADLADLVQAGGLSGADALNQIWSQQKGSAIDPTAAMQEYDFARQQGYAGDFTTWKTDVARAGASNIDFNNSQALAGGYADRMANANSIIDDPKITQAQTDPVQAGIGAIPGVGNFLTSNERKLAEQAQRDFLNAILRRESGAVIAESEFQNAARQYFPQPGDTPEVIEQKRRNREIAIQGVARAAGPSYQQPSLGGGAGWQIVGVE